jgi:1,5-anhydro-D-fructose reductase (1,5-anhydro-D-mannitol-forming)
MALGWGIIGPGRIADTAIAPGINRSDDSFLQAVVSRDQTRAETFAAKHQAARALTSYEDMLADPKVDVVYISTPNAEHPKQAVAAMRAGKHVLCDKPLATSVAEAERMVATARETGVKLGTGFQSRHHAAHQEARRLIESGAIGEVILVQCEVSSGASRPVSWRTDPELAGAAALNNIGVHPNDLVRYLIGSEVVEVVAMNDCGPGEWLDLLDLILLKFENGAMAYVNANQKVPDFQPDIDIYGTKGRIVGHKTTRPFLDGELRVKIGDEESSTPYTSKDAFDRQIAAFNRAVIEDREPNASGLDGLRSVQITDAVLRSVGEGVRVRLTY